MTKATYFFSFVVVMALPALAVAQDTTFTATSNQTQTVTPVIVGGDLPYSVDVTFYDNFTPKLHSYIAGEHDGKWVVLGGLNEGLHSFIDNRTSTTDRNPDIWVIDPIAKTAASRSLADELVPDANNIDSAKEKTFLSLTSANTQFEQVGDRLYVTGGYGDDLFSDPSSRTTFDTLSSLDLPGLIDWVETGSGLASDHIRQTSDPLFKVTGGDMYEIDGKMHLVFGQDFEDPYSGSGNGVYTHQVRTFEIADDAGGLSFSGVSTSGDETNNPEFRRRDLNIHPYIRDNGGQLERGITVLSGVFTPGSDPRDFGAWTVPVDIDADGNAVQVDFGNDPLGTSEPFDANDPNRGPNPDEDALDNDSRVFKQAMNNYHAAKLGLFSEETGGMHELLFGGITFQEYAPAHPDADANGFVADKELPNTSQITSVIRTADGLYEQHLMGAFPERTIMLDGENEARDIHYGSNAEFFLADGMPTYDNGVLNLDALPFGETVVGYIYGGIATYDNHVFRDARRLSDASGDIFLVTINRVPEPSTAILVVGVVATMGVWLRRKN